MKDKIHIPHPTSLEEKIRIFKAGGAEKLHTIADFDKTLTTKDGHIFEQLKKSRHIRADYGPLSQAMYDHFYPAYISTTLSLEEKRASINEWLHFHLDLLTECGMKKETVSAILKEQGIDMRERFPEFLRLLKEHDVPLLIISAGFGDFIEEQLRMRAQEHDQLHIAANFFAYDEEGRLAGFNAAPLNPFNKHNRLSDN